MKMFLALILLFAPQTPGGGLPEIPKTNFCGHSAGDFNPPNVSPRCECAEQECLDAAKDAYQATMLDANNAACDDINDGFSFLQADIAQCNLPCVGDPAGCAAARNRCLYAAFASMRQTALGVKQAVAITQQGAVIDYVHALDECCADCDR